MYRLAVVPVEVGVRAGVTVTGRVAVPLAVAVSVRVGVTVGVLLSVPVAVAVGVEQVPV